MVVIVIVVLSLALSMTPTSYIVMRLGRQQWHVYHSYLHRKT